MGTEIEVRQRASLPAKVEYAKMLADSGLLPAQYRGRPANILWAIEYGDMLGLSTMAAITGVHVIEGKPTASAGLISGLVREAGHILRVRGDGKSATCVIIRSDDPEHPFEVTWTLKRNKDDNPSAEEAGLLGKDVWKKYPASMLKSRAITQCARDACEEVLYGLHYTPEELGAEVDEDGAVLGGTVEEAQVVETDAGWMAATLRVIPEIGLDASRKLWREVRDKAKAGELAEADEAHVLGILKAHMEALAKTAPQQAGTAGQPPAGDAADVVDAEIVDDTPVLDPEDPWAPKVDEIATDEDARAALDEAAGRLTAGAIDAARFGVIEAAILARFPGAQNAPAAAA